MDERQLLALKKQVEDAKTQVSELTGQRTALMKQLKDDWGCTTVEAAEKKIKAMETEITQLDEEINKGIKTLETKFEL